MKLIKLGLVSVWLFALACNSLQKSTDKGDTSVHRNLSEVDKSAIDEALDEWEVHQNGEKKHNLIMSW